ncbi:hypothetical protein HOLleu_35317 [Holothuria leucospilota]|uniref:Uncharacterized protein n=1 Tax=Holothuria leucospilota TaxID=206669 RepID=A0A9Q0YME8_HOLLE|nr:hypothetical protein HOLleu_35317 [Holothuria leucospilota]
MGNMTEFLGHFYQPLCVIIDTLDDVSHSKESSVSDIISKLLDAGIEIYFLIY